MKQIEQFFAACTGAEFGTQTREYPYRIIGPTESDSHIAFATKWDCLFRGLHESGPPDGVGMIIRYGLPSREDLPWLADIIGNRRVLFLGDLDPTDLLIFVWLRSNLEAGGFEHFGVNDRFLSELHVTIPDSYTIELDETEVEAVTLLESVWPELEADLGPWCLQLLRNGRKIEQEAVVTSLGSQSAILRLLERPKR